jgi:hypothetical protein
VNCSLQKDKVQIFLFISPKSAEAKKVLLPTGVLKSATQTLLPSG